MVKLGRNDPCHCGSGKKYKHCHWQQDQLTEVPNKDIDSLEAFGKLIKEATRDTITEKGNSFTKLAETHNTASILNYVTNLQLVPENHGKNLRLEILAKEAIKRQNAGIEPDEEILKKTISESYPYHHGEDPPEGLYTETILFHGGNYTIMPGIASRSGDIMRAMTEAVFMYAEEFPKGFQHDVYQGVTLLLETAQFIFNKAKVQRNIFIESEETAIRFPETIIDASISLEELLIICRKKGISPSKYHEFVTTHTDPALTETDADLNPLLYKPLVIIDDRIYFPIISAQVMAINECIIRTAIKHNCINKFLEIYHKNIWSGVSEACASMNWKRTNIRPPFKTKLPVKEAIYNFDSNGFAYVIQYCHQSISEKEKEEEHYMTVAKNGNFENLDRHIKKTVNYFKTNAASKNWNILILIVVEDIGRNMMMSISRAEKGVEKIWFNCFEFMQLANVEKWDRLSLLKYARVYNEASQKMALMNSDAIDMYAVYKDKGESFYIDDESYNHLTVMPGMGADLYRLSKQKQDMHGALAYHNGRLVYKLVERVETFAPIYSTVHRSDYNLLLEAFHFPFWIISSQVKAGKAGYFLHNTVQAIFYWINILSSDLKNFLEDAIKFPLTVDVILDEILYKDISFEEMRGMDLNKEYKSLYKDHVLEFHIPGSWIQSMKGNLNNGERELIKQLLLAFNKIPDVSIEEPEIDLILNDKMPVSNRKMILILDSTMDIQLDTRWLPSLHYITSAEVNLLLDHLVEIIKYPESIPEEFKSEEEKKRFCNHVVTALLQKLNEFASSFNKEILLHSLIALHERLIFKREHNKIILPSQIICFGREDDHIQDNLIEEKRLVITTLAVRSLIEFAATLSSKAEAVASLDDIDKMLAIMDEILNYGMISDAIHFGLDNPKIGLLPSGRIGIEKSFFDDKLKPFSDANQQSDIDDYLEAFDDQFEIWSNKEATKEENDFWKKLDDAFLADWNIGLSELNQIIFGSIRLAIEEKTSILHLPKEEFISRILKLTGLSSETIQIGLNRLSIVHRQDFMKAPEGYKNEEVFPWKYNREFSVLRRPYIEYSSADGSSELIWGMRQAMQASKQLHQLLFTGRLKFGGREINRLLGEQNESRGKRFRNTAKDYLKQFDYLQVWEYEVKIGPSGHLKAEKDFGDIDLLVFDRERKVVYGIECKRTQQAKNIHEMKKELDSYLGRKGTGGMIQKHVQRNEWLQDHKDELKAFISDPSEIEIKCFLLTSEVVPIIYIKESDLPLPIISYPDLKRNGPELFRQLQ